jgi:hypothetical protein
MNSYFHDTLGDFVDDQYRLHTVKIIVHVNRYDQRKLVIIISTIINDHDTGSLLITLCYSTKLCCRERKTSSIITLHMSL